MLLNQRPTQPFSKSVVERIQADPEFAQALWQEAVQLFLSGDPVTAKLLLRDLVNATVGFEELAERINKPSKSVNRMLSLSGNPTMDNLSVIFAAVSLRRLRKPDVLELLHKNFTAFMGGEAELGRAFFEINAL